MKAWRRAVVNKRKLVTRSNVASQNAGVMLIWRKFRNQIRSVKSLSLWWRWNWYGKIQINEIEWAHDFEIKMWYLHFFLPLKTLWVCRFALHFWLAHYLFTHLFWWPVWHSLTSLFIYNTWDGVVHLHISPLCCSIAQCLCLCLP